MDNVIKKKVELVAKILKFKYPEIKWEEIDSSYEKLYFTADTEDTLILSEKLINEGIEAVCLNLNTKLKTYHPNFYAAHANELCKS